MAKKTTPERRPPEPQTTSVLEILNAGKIIQRVITLPPGGGVVVLRGMNEEGKSTCLDAVSEICGRRTELTRNYNADVAEITLRTPLGSRTVKIHATQKRPSGMALNQLEIEHIEDRFDVADLVDPGFKDAESCDAVRIKTIVQMTGAKIDWSEFEAIRPPTMPGTDPVSLEKAKSIKDTVPQAQAVQNLFYAEKRRYLDLEQEARGEELKSEAAVGDLDLTLPSDATVLQDAYRVALSTQTRLQEQVDAAQTARLARAEAQDKLAARRGSYQGPTIPQAESAVEAVQAEVQQVAASVQDANSVVARLEAELNAARHAVQMARVRQDASKQKLQAEQDRLQAARDYEQAILDMTGLLDATLPEPPGPELLEASAQELETAQAAMNLGVRIREALANRQSAEKFRQKANAYAERAEAFKQAGLAVDDLLSRAVNVPCFRVVGGTRLLYTDEQRSEMFHSLSKGKRAIEAIKIGARSVSDRGGSGTKLLRLDQDIWQDLDPHHRDVVADICALEEITVLTAECSAGPLREVIYGQPDAWEQQGSVAV